MELIRSSKKVQIIISLVVSLLMTIGYSILASQKSVLLYGYRFIIFFSITMILMILISNNRESFLDYCYRNRYWILIVLILVGTILNINGSSISSWNDYVPEEGRNIVFGLARSIRSDEWATYTPMAISQKYGEHPFSVVSNLLRGTETDVQVVYALPTREILSILFRPFLSGYLLFGYERGISFFWCARLCCLWMAYFELSMLITNNNRKLSLLGAFLVAFTPIVQWWFAINGLVEMLIFGAGALLALNKYLLSKSYKQRFWLLLGMYVCAGGYVYTMYPASMVPLFYFFLIIAIWLIHKNRKELYITKWDILMLVVTVIFLGLTIGYYFLSHWNTIQTVLNTSYPGNRTSAGGGSLKSLFFGWGNIFFPYLMNRIPVNACESAVVFDLFPLGIILSIIGTKKTKKIDVLNTLFWVLMIITAIYSAFGLPEIVAKITMLSLSTSNRTLIVPGVCNLFLLIRCLAIYDYEFSKKKSFIISGVITTFVIVLSVIVYDSYLGTIKIFALFIICYIVSYLILRYKKNGNIAIIMCCSCVLIAGSTVNPIQIGSSNVTSSKLACGIRKIVDEDPNAKWIVDNMNYPMVNYPIMQGAVTVNSTNIYPNLKLWKSLDKDGVYEDLYNRYVHVKVYISDENSIGEKFSLEAADQLVVRVTSQELIDELDVKYLLSDRKLENYNTDKIKFECMESFDYELPLKDVTYRIYKIDRED